MAVYVHLFLRLSWKLSFKCVINSFTKSSWSGDGIRKKKKNCKNSQQSYIFLEGIERKPWQWERNCQSCCRKLQEMPGAGSSLWHPPDFHGSRSVNIHHNCGFSFIFFLSLLSALTSFWCFYRYHPPTSPVENFGWKTLMSLLKMIWASY